MYKCIEIQYQGILGHSTKKCIIVFYRDDCCIFALSNAIINALIDSLKSECVLEDQGRIDDYLGICIDQQVNHETNFVECMTLTQVGLIDNFSSQ